LSKYLLVVGGREVGVGRRMRSDGMWVAVVVVVVVVSGGEW
jgi:hypothetical protein